MVKDNYTCVELIGYIQTSIEILMKLKKEQDEVTAHHCKRCKLEIKEKILERKRQNNGDGDKKEMKELHGLLD